MDISKDETTWAMIAHLSNLVNLFTFVLGPIIAIIIYFVYRDRSKYVSHQAMQSFVYQMITVIFCGFLAVAAWIVTGVLSIVLVGICLIPFATILTLIPLVGMVYSVIAAVETSAGKHFHYAIIGNWIKD